MILSSDEFLTKRRRGLSAGAIILCSMETVTLKLERRHIKLLKDYAKALGRSQAAVIRDLIDQHLECKTRVSLHEQAKSLCGSVRGTKDLSTRRLTNCSRG